MGLKEILDNADKSIEENRELALKHGKLQESIDNLLALEKQTRLAEDLAGTTLFANAIVRLCFDCADWKQLNNQLVVLSKRRAQLKQVIVKFVQEAMTYLDKTPDHETKLQLIDTLRTITAGKIYVENERARLTRMLAKIKEDDGNVAEAAEIMQEVQVETFGTMEKREKVDFLLEQVRLLLDRNDYIRAQIISKKISPKFLADPEVQDLKVRNHRLMIRYYAHNNSYLDMAKSYHAIYSTPNVQADRAQWIDELEHVAVLLVLAPYDNEQSDFLNRVYEDKKLAELDDYKKLLKYFLTPELVRWPILEGIYRPILMKSNLFEGETNAKQRWGDFNKRVVEHNIRVIGKYYSRISSARLSQLLDLSPEDTEQNVRDMVVAKTLYARIDRPSGVISFVKPKQPAELLNEWSSNIGNLLNLVESSCHLIHKEIMVYQATHPSASA
mmetsp:Transcript_25895/g.42541  ORF Transcript_25895/g.42541 Transcript_25895/m.42541 type:complete len:443 (+) Transcript_25895:30-1358(+)|eukprot:CAMPEP_0184341300 /NCGR_PEP_ID=MMETSP1089-20130417/9914_1 /TAXON_ID=38269 ORGANISM="Gloeochaete wittrockiana, Strain SAG46.84" /NCGR_SAMPLE_ID=MMETSP1089 /ASSEMBLY_ACC=CAM_ASM_000445 /LENGTH=442 /DNA_ID=CAMNT_0026669519 /DNA_START=25 /DNA_END=1353 /DNA_ORIENTATION=-